MGEWAKGRMDGVDGVDGVDEVDEVDLVGGPPLIHKTSTPSTESTPSTRRVAHSPIRSVASLARLRLWLATICNFFPG
jgi:hypothetical protein